MTDKTKKALDNALASARIEGFEFTDTQLDMLISLIEQVDSGEITGFEAIQSIIEKCRW